MLPPLLILLFTILGIEIIAGFMGNGFIAALICSDWIRNRKISSSDTILISLSISRFVLQGTITVYIHSLYFPGMPKLATLYKAFCILWMFVKHASLYVFSTWLSVFYRVKIINFTQLILLRMKLRISGMVPWFLLGSMLVSSITTLPMFWIFPSISSHNSTGNHVNNSVKSTALDTSSLSIASLYCAGCFFPLTISFFTSVLLIVSLWKHTKKMQHNTTSCQDPRTNVHANAIKTLVSFLILYLSSFIAQIPLILLASQNSHTWEVAVSLVVVAAYPSGHSIILILINSKLKQASVRLFNYTMYPLTKGTP
ncbi:LOW QUALITY PROTEIN: taste receptor type 2 member 40-like [Alligator sinensis]|uniref:Taste receptor type 2 n=1 Tax=Alligator sinensis TaxID=38654 RepID=A0A1U8DAQ7_ALLSI|nr:LOW QUALITY PROTEIN: taste receptor type 2 member 40-like [Alligator sinensis]